jgi:hypothetical protein
VGLVGIIARYSRPYTVTRTLAGVRTTGGHYASGGTSSIPIRAHVQPFVGNGQLQDLPEGMSAVEVKIVWTTTQLIPVADGIEPDHIQIGLDRCRVFQVDDWDASIAHYYRCLVEKVSIP